MPRAYIESAQWHCVLTGSIQSLRKHNAPATISECLIKEANGIHNMPVVQEKQEASSWSPWTRSVSRVVTFGINEDNQFGAPTEYRSSGDFQAYLRTRDKPSRTIYILEGLAPDFTAVTSDHFRLHPSVFTDHHRLVAFSGRATGESGGLPFLPSSIQGRHHISLKYHEALTICSRPTCFRNICQVSGRHIMATRMSGTFSEVVIARRKCTVWFKKTGGGGWDCMYLPQEIGNE